jgi:hypothetical protein
VEEGRKLRWCASGVVPEFTASGLCSFLACGDVLLQDLYVSGKRIWLIC